MKYYALFIYNNVLSDTYYIPKKCFASRKEAIEYGDREAEKDNKEDKEYPYWTYDVVELNVQKRRQK